MTIGVGYALYFPLMLYLSTRFSFAWALTIAVAVPGALLLNFARWLLGLRIGLAGGAIFLGLYQVFPTLAAFSGWNRGMVLLCLGVVTLWVLINLQNQALKRHAAKAVVLFAIVVVSGPARAAEIQVVLPAELAGKLLDRAPEAVVPQLTFETAQYEVRHEPTFFHVEVTCGFEAQRAGDTAALLFAEPVHLRNIRIETPEPDTIRPTTASNRIGLLVERPGRATLKVSYRAAITGHDGKKRVEVPLLIGPAAGVLLDSERPDLETLTGSIWSRTAQGQRVAYEIGVVGEERLVLEWRDHLADAALGTHEGTAATRDFYGIGLTQAQNLTVIASDGSCTHFAEFDLPAYHQDGFRLRLPPGVRLISVSIDGTEIAAPTVEDRLCQVRLPERLPRREAHRLSFHLVYPPVRLGFMGSLDLSLPGLFQTVGTLEWVVALPNGFETQVIASGLEAQKASVDLARFGDYGRVLKSHPYVYLGKTLAPPGTANVNLKYRQLVAGLSDPAVK
jgi:hypothetical protein